MTAHLAPGDEGLVAALHVRNGDATDVANTGLAPRVLVWFHVLHEGPVPAVAPTSSAASGPATQRATRLRRTGTGARALAGEEDHVALNGIDRWIGGVHLHGHRVAWRFDEGTEAITPAA